MSENFYWESEGQVYGPLTIDDLIARVAAGQIDSADRLRVGEDGEWASAVDTIAAVQVAESSRVPESAVDASSSAARILDKSKLLLAKRSGSLTAKQSFGATLRGWLSFLFMSSTTGRPAESTKANPPAAKGESADFVLPQTFLRRQLQWLSQVVERVTSPLAAGIGFVLEKLWTKPGKVIISGLLLSALTLIVLPHTPYGEPSMARIAVEIEVAHLIITDLRETNASDDEWDSMQVEVLSELVPLVEEMEELHKDKPTNVPYFFSGSRARGVVRRDVVSAGKYCIPRIFLEVRNDNDPLIEQLEGHIENIRNHVSGDEPYPMSVAEARKRKQSILAKERRWRAKTRFFRETDTATLAVIGFDVLLVFGGIFLFIRKRRSGKQ